MSGRWITNTTRKFSLMMVRRFDWSGDGDGQCRINWPKGRKTPAEVIVHLRPEYESREHRELYELSVAVAKDGFIKAGIPLKFFERINWFIPVFAEAVETIIPGERRSA